MNKKNKQKKIRYEDEDDEGEEEYEKTKLVGLIVERTFRDSALPS